MNNYLPGGRGGHIPPFMARGGVGRPPMHGHGGYGPGPGGPYMHHPRIPMHHGGPPPYGGGYDYGADYGVPPGHNPPAPAPRMRMQGGRALAPPLAGAPVAAPSENPLMIPPKPPSSAASDFSSNSKVESIVSETDDLHNDSEIIILERSHDVEKYAEGIEKTIREIGLTVDLMYPNDDVIMKDFLQGLAKRGTNFALVIRQENEENGSITLHILKPTVVTGVVETHRNAPREIVFEIMRDGKKAIKRAQVSRIPKDVKTALNDVIGGGLLKDSAYQACIRYLSTRWQRQMDYEERREYDEGTGILSEEQLQRKIEKILGVDRDDVTEQGDAKLGRAIGSLLSSSSVLKALHEQNENKNPGGKHPHASGSDGGGGPPHPKFPRAGSISSAKSGGSGGLPKKSPGYF